MSKLNELRQERGVIIKTARDLLDKVEAEKRSLTDEESGQYDELIAKQEDLRGKIEREERQVELDREAAASIADNEDRQSTPAPESNEMDEIRAFGMALANGVHGLPAAAMRALKMGSDDAGGYLVPPIEWVNRLIQAVDNQVFLRQWATKFTVATSQSMGAPSLENDPADADWTTELGIGTEDTTLDFGSRALEPHPLAKLLKVSEKLMRATGQAESIVLERLAYKQAVTQEKAFLTGTGANQPLGVFTASSLGISTTRDVSTGNSTTAIAADNLIEVKYSLKSAYHAAANWLFHRDAVKNISKLKDGDGQYLWRPGIVANEPDRILGHPVNMSEYAPNTFTTGLYVGMLADFSHYWIADALDVRIQRLNELYAATAQVGFISRSETDGMPVLEEAFARVKLA